MIKNRTLYIIYERYYDFDNNCVLSGGIQTYLSNLIPIFISKGFRCKLFQAGTNNQSVELDNVFVTNVKVDLKKGYDRAAKLIFNTFKNEFDDERDYLLFATECFSFDNKLKNTIAIQHGICWDIPCHTEFSKKMNNFYVFRKAKNTYESVKRASRANTVICVDYNYINWFRASTAYQSIDFKAIPNFTEIAPLLTKQSDTVNIIFARRLETYRGTEVFLKAISKILDEFEIVKVTIAGRGPEKQHMKDVLRQYGDRVSFIEYTSDESIKIHSTHHIAVVPTIGSEGTSLSLLESMSSQCAVVCSDVGGMTNIVLNGFNGLIVSSGNVEELYNALKQLIEDENLRKRISYNGYETVKQSFSKERWVKQWEEVVNNLLR